MSDIPADARRETWDSVYEESVKLAHLIAKACEQSGEAFDSMIVIARGSYFPVNIISRELGFLATDMLHVSMTSYVSGTTKQEEFKLGQMPAKSQIRGRNLLIIDEVCDTGRTFEYLTNWLKEQGAALVRTGVIHYKENQSTTGFVPDYFVVKTDEWIVYPWEVHDHPEPSHVKRPAKD
ncbi:MAG TPA: phosphoribosyltransferase family protein [Candidatus Saccharimonadales bacterium]|nr:phosphoribosyltransferase family protein [Candidatus Saccharimonadales bacterium]